MTRLLHDNITEGTGTAAYTGCAGQAGKTGTTDEYTDAWFAGYQPNLATAVWVGYPESNDISMSSVHGITVFGGTFPAEIWHSLYSEAAASPARNSKNRSSRSAGRPYYGQLHPALEPQRRAQLGGRSGGERRPPPPGQRRGRRLRPQRLRARAPGRNRRRCRHRRPRQRSGVGGGESRRRAGS